MLTNWTDDRVTDLTKLWEAGYTSSQIAAELGGTTRNAVCGKVHRMGISVSAPSNKGGSKKSPAEIEASKRRKTERRKQTRHFARLESICPARPLVCEEVTPRNLTLMDLEPNDCRWPYGGSPFVFCGNPKFHGSYCSSHYFASIGPGTSSEQAATRVSTDLLVHA